MLPLLLGDQAERILEAREPLDTELESHADQGGCPHRIILDREPCRPVNDAGEVRLDVVLEQQVDLGVADFAPFALVDQSADADRPEAEVVLVSVILATFLALEVPKDDAGK